MKKKCGFHAYIPPEISTEIQEIKIDLGIDKQSEAFKIMAKNSNKFRNIKKGGFKFNF